MLRLGELCAGYGGLGLALELAGIETELAWYSEHDPSNSKQPAARIMAHHHPGVPNLGDLRDITDPPPVDIVTAGFPCQPVSAAGQRAGVGDDRWLIRDVVAVWRRTGARWLILENVSGLRSANDGEAFGQVIDSLAEVGAACEWTHLRASDVGACHRRERWFCVATRNTEGGSRDAELATRRRGDRQPSWPLGRSDSATQNADIEPGDERRFATPGKAERGRSRPDSGRRDRTPTADADGIASRRDSRTTPRTQTPREDEPGEPDGHRSGATCRTFGQYAPAIAQQQAIFGRPTPEPTVAGKWIRELRRSGGGRANTRTRSRRLNPVFVEWMMGLPQGHVTVTNTTRAEQLGVLGNGVVIQQAAHAITQLIERTA